MGEKDAHACGATGVLLDWLAGGSSLVGMQVGVASAACTQMSQRASAEQTGVKGALPRPSCICNTAAR